MNIKNINAEHTDKGKIALRTDPEITEPVFRQFMRLSKDQEIFKSVTFSRITCPQNGSLLVVNTKAPTPEIAQAIEKILDGAEKAHLDDERAAQEKIESAKSEKSKAAEMASEAFSVPIFRIPGT